MAGSKKRIVVCGAGAAGLTAAIFAAETGADVTLLERTDKAGKKILMSGGTRCNVLPVIMQPGDYFTDSSPNRMKNIFRSWNLEACRRWFEEEVGLKLACESETNKWFPVSNSAKEVRNLLLDKALKNGVNIKYNQTVEHIQRQNNQWEAVTGSGTSHSGNVLIISTGGYSIPTTGTDGMGHRFLEKAGHTMHAVYPALTPLLCDNKAHQSLSGLSLNVQLDVYVDGRKAVSSNRNGFLFTHRGYSGPAVLDVSHFAVRALEFNSALPEYRVNWGAADRKTWEKRFNSGSGNVISVLAGYLPRRLAEVLSAECGLESRRIAELKKPERKLLLSRLTEYNLPVTGHEGYRKAEVTGGGVPLEEINTATLESSKLPGVFLCGEILDVFGRIGGFNFYWAWVTGRLAGIGAGKII